MYVSYLHYNYIYPLYYVYIYNIYIHDNYLLLSVELLLLFRDVNFGEGTAQMNPQEMGRTCLGEWYQEDTLW